MMHVDEFIDMGPRPSTSETAYARWFFLLHRLPAILQSDFSDIIKKYKLFCDYDGKPHRVTGCSRLGDVWLTTDFNRDLGYELRVDLDQCSNWRRELDSSTTT